MAASLITIVDWIRAAVPAGRLVSDSRRVQPGDVFFAYPGDAADGRGHSCHGGHQRASRLRGEPRDAHCAVLGRT